MGAGAGVVRALRQRAVGGDPQGQRIARDQAFDAAHRFARIVLGPRVKRRVRFADVVAGDPDERDADRKQGGAEDQQQLYGGWQSGEAPCRAAQHVGSPVKRSCELPEQIRKIVGNSFAQRVVVDRSKRATDIARPLLTTLLFVRRLRVRRLSRGTA